MSLPERLAARRAEILARWRNQIAGAEARLAPRRPDPFADPVGAAVQRATEAVYDAVAGCASMAAAAEALTELVGIRAVQERGASESMGFLLQLRYLVRAALADELERESPAARDALDARLDALALQAFDVYVARRQKAFELRAREARASTFLLLRRARLLGDGDLEGERLPEAGADAAHREAP